MAQVPLLRLNSGFTIPQLGLGTWLSPKGEVGSAVAEALGLGYRHIDCAMAYQNQQEIGAIFKDIFGSGKFRRQDVFVTSKIWNTFHSFQKASEAIDIILEDLGLPYLDLCLIHWPQGYVEDRGLFPKDDNGKIINADTDYLETWKAMESAVASGKIRSLGVSNFNKDQVLRINKEASIKMANLQVEAHPYFSQENCVSFCQENDLLMTAFSPLSNPTHMFRKEGQPNLLQDPIMVKIGEKYHKSTAQVGLRWAIQRGTVVIPKSTSKKRLQENLEVFDFELTDEDMGEISGLERGFRILALERDLDHPLFPFHVHF